MSKKIKPDWELEQSKINLLKKENKLGFIRNVIEANRRRIEFLNVQNGGMIKGLEDSIASLELDAANYVKQIEDINAYMKKMLDLQQPKRKVKKKSAKKTAKKKSKKQLLAEKQAALKAEMARLKAEAEAEEIVEEPEKISEPVGEEPSQTETTT